MPKLDSDYRNLPKLDSDSRTGFQNSLDSHCTQLENESTCGDDAEVESPSHFSHHGSFDDVKLERGDNGDVESPR